MPDVAVSGFVVNRQYVRVEAPEDAAFAGFWAEVRQNLTNGERRDLMTALEEIAIRETEALAANDAERVAVLGEMEAVRSQDSPVQRNLTLKASDVLRRGDDIHTQYRNETWALIAPHIRAWNAVLMDGDEVMPIAPPAEAGVEAFDLVTLDMAEWLAPTVLMAYRLGKDVSLLLKKRGDSPPRMGGPKPASGKANKPATQRRRTNSSSLSASMFQA